MIRAGVLRAIALNVRSLAAKLDLILALPCEVFCLSEVRASWSAKRSMSRVAAAAGFSAVWSNSPPPSPTFSVSPGGCAIFVRAPLSAQEIRAPALERWVSEAGLCLAKVCDAGRNTWCFASCYGYPVSHQNRGALSAPNHKSQIASDLKSQSPNRKNFPQIAVSGSSNRTFKSRDL